MFRAAERYPEDGTSRRPVAQGLPRPRWGTGGHAAGRPSRLAQPASVPAATPYRLTGGRLLGGAGEAHARRGGDSGRCATEPGCASDASTVFLLFVAFRLGSSSLGRRPGLSCPPSGSDRDRSITVVGPAWLNHKVADRVVPGEVAGHGVDNGQVVHGFGSGRERLVSADRTPVEHQPSVGPLDRLTLWGRGAARQLT